MIPFNKPFISGPELSYINNAVSTGTLSGNGTYTKLCQTFFKERYGFQNCLLTTSCTDALEMAALLMEIKEGDEVIMPSFTFVSTANAFILRGAKIVFVDSKLEHPGIDEEKIEPLINTKTKAIVVVHYAGVACNMDKIMNIANKYGLFVVEDAAQAIDSYYKTSDGLLRPLGSIGHFGAFSFHETKNIISGEGGLLCINDDQFSKRAEIIWEKGTNRSAFYRGEVDKYGWVDIGSSFLPSELIAAFLYAQLENLQSIQRTRLVLWDKYKYGLSELFKRGKLIENFIPEYATNNGHMYYVICTSGKERDELIKYLKDHNIHAVFHYQPLHQSLFHTRNNQSVSMPNSETFAETLLRLPLFYELNPDEQDTVINCIISYFGS